MSGDDKKSLLISSFQDKYSQEVVAILVAWLSNGLASEDYFAETFVRNTMRIPREFLAKYKETNAYAQCGDKTFWGLLTYAHLHALLVRIIEIKERYGSLRRAFEVCVAQGKYKYAHEVFMDIFGEECGFPTKKGNGTFYRYNLLAYFLTYNPCVWDKDVIKNALIPCDNNIIANANKMRITRRRLQANILAPIRLTKVAKERFGEEDFYKMYELLK